MLKDLVSPESASTENTCAGCGASIKDRYYLLAADRAWHGQCLRCCRCSQALDTELSCFCRDGNIYCKDCRIFSSRQCAKCGDILRCDELVMRARDLIFHVHCFCCAFCKIPLSAGDTAALQGGQLFCGDHVAAGADLEQHMMRLVQPINDEPSPTTHSFYCASPQKGRPRKRKCSPHAPSNIGLTLTHPSLLLLDQGGGSSHLAESLDSNSPRNSSGEAGAELRLDLISCPEMQSNIMDVSSYDGSSHSPTSGGCMTPHSRSKRMRTSFKHHQLRSMKSYFAINQNPDAKDLKSLAQKTGLSKRVLQVWFQNARAKWRRNMMRQEQQANGGTPMNKSGMIMLPTISHLTSSMIAENCHLLRNGSSMSSSANMSERMDTSTMNDPVLGDPRVESSPSQTSSLDEIQHMTSFAELY